MASPRGCNCLHFMSNQPSVISVPFITPMKGMTPVERRASPPGPHDPDGPFAVP